MIARLLICPDTNKIREEIQKTLALHLESLPTSAKLRQAGVTVNHPDLLHIQTGEKLGIAEAKKIKEFFSLKPYSAKGRAVALEDASVLTHEAQNALLKTIEELPKEAILILGASSNANLLPTILSRCEIINLESQSDGKLNYTSKYTKDLERLLDFSVEERFKYIEKLKEREEFLHSMVHYFREQLVHSKARQALKNFLEELLQSEEWVKHNVNTRAILEYLMLVMPGKK